MDEYRYESVVVSLTSQEKQALRVVAALAGTSMSSYVREVLASTGCLKALEGSQLLQDHPGTIKVEVAKENDK